MKSECSLGIHVKNVMFTKYYTLTFKGEFSYNNNWSDNMKKDANGQSKSV